LETNKDESTTTVLPVNRETASNPSIVSTPLTATFNLCT